MGKNKRKALEDPAMNDTIKEEGDPQSEEAVVTASKHKKHKKSKKDDQETPSKQLEHADDPSKEEGDPQTQETTVTASKHKKHKKSKKEQEAKPSNQSEPHTDEQETDRKKKKKKKRKADDEDDAVGDMKPPKQKKLKVMNGTDFPESERSCTSKVVPTEGSSFEAVETVSGANCVKKKKNKDRKTGKEVNPLTLSEQSAVNGSQLEGPSVETSVDGYGNSQPDKVKNEDKKKKKKHKKNKSEINAGETQNVPSDGCQENGTDFSERTSKKKEKADKLKTSKSEVQTHAEQKDLAEEVKQEKKDKKKKKKKKEKAEESVIPTQCSSNGENHSASMKDEKASKKKKQAESMPESTVSKTEAAMPDLQDCSNKTKKKKKKKSKDKEQKDAAEDTVHGEGTETDDGKQKQDATINSGETPTSSKVTNGKFSQSASVGQWGSNMFNDNARQNKFLRLLGGFKKAGDGSQVAPGHKKGLFGSLQPQDSTTGGHRALTYQAAQAMDRRLESDYERALSFSKSGQRGVGLGFQPDPAEGKKFHIDANRVASKKFD